MQHLYATDLPLEGEDWDRLLAIGKRQNYGKRDVICTEDDDASDYYIVLTGAVEIFKVIAPATPTPGATSAEIRLALLEPGASFGERCLFDGTRRNASARAYLDSELLIIDGTQLATMLAKDESLASRFYRALCAKLSKILGDVEADLRHMHRRHTFY